MKIPPAPMATILALATTVLVPAAEPRIYFGTYDSPNSRGIYSASWNAQTGEAGAVELAGETKSPSFLALTPDQKFIVAANESGTAANPEGAVSVFAVDPVTGKLKPVSEQSSKGAGPCHVSVSADGKMVIVANYGGGSVASYSLMPDGQLSPPGTFIQHDGQGALAERQSGPHAHSGTFAPNGQFAFFCDLGLDRIFGCRVYPNLGTLEPLAPPSISLKGGSGPRHFAFHPRRPLAYVINELNSTVSTLGYDAKSGLLQLMHSTGTLPADFSGQNSTAHIAVHPSGKWVYGSNRGHDSIARFTVDASTGWLRFAEATPTGGKTPRNFALDPTGTWMLAANQDSDSVTIFKIDPATGQLTATGRSLTVGKPVCVVFSGR